MAVNQLDGSNQIFSTFMLQTASERIQPLLAYNANVDSDTVTVVNTENNSIVSTVTLPAGSFPIAIVILPDGSRAYTVNQNTDSVSVIETSTNSLITTILAGVIPFGISAAPDSSRVDVAGNLSNSVIVVNTATNTVLNEITATGRPISVGVHRMDN